MSVALRENGGVDAPPLRFFKIEFLDRSDSGSVLEFRFVKVSVPDVAEIMAKLGLGGAATRGAQSYRVLDERGVLIARGPDHEIETGSGANPIGKSPNMARYSPTTAS